MYAYVCTYILGFRYMMMHCHISSLMVKMFPSSQLRRCSYWLNQEFIIYKKESDVAMPWTFIHLLLIYYELLIKLHLVISYVNYQVVQAARDHYNCSTLRGVPLENNGAQGSRGLGNWFLVCQFYYTCMLRNHWESRVVFPEVMNAAIFDT